MQGHLNRSEHHVPARCPQAADLGSRQPTKSPLTYWNPAEAGNWNSLDRPWSPEVIVIRHLTPTETGGMLVSLCDFRPAAGAAADGRPEIHECALGTARHLPLPTPLAVLEDDQGYGTGNAGHPWSIEGTHYEPLFSDSPRPPADPPAGPSGQRTIKFPISYPHECGFKLLHLAPIRRLGQYGCLGSPDFPAFCPPFPPQPPFSRPPVRPPALSTAFTTKGNSWQ